MTRWMKLRFLPSLPFNMVFDGEDDLDDNLDDDVDPPNPDDKDKDKDKDKKKVELDIPLNPSQQAFFNAKMAEERRKGKEATNKLITQLKTQQQRADTTEAERKDIEEQIERLRGEYATKEENNKKSMERKLKEETEKRERAEAVAKDWENLYTEERIDGDLNAAAIEIEAYHPDPVKAILRPKTRLVAELDQDNKPTGKKTTRVKMEKTQDGKVQVLEMTPVEAVKYMKEQPEKYGNLFISKAAGGIGGHNFNGGGGSGGSDSAPPKDPAQYAEWRKKQKSAGKMR